MNKYQFYPETKQGEHNGAFRLRRQGNDFLCIISNGGGWDHVSVSIDGKHRCPTWDEMSWIKDQFFDETETVVQYHPPKSDHINLHPFCLHLWRRQGAMPRPDSIMVGPKLKGVR